VIVLGIDPGLATMGFGVIQRKGPSFQALDYGVITTPAGMALPARLEDLYCGVTRLLEKHQPDAVSVEELFFARNTTSAFGVSQARGVALLAAQQARVELFEYTPMQVKQAICGYGHADKAQVQFMVQRLLALPGKVKPDDAADALAIALCRAQSGALTGQFRIS